MSYDYDRRLAHTDAIENTRAVPPALAALDKLLGNFRTHFGDGPVQKDVLARFAKRLRAGKATKTDVFGALSAVENIVTYLKQNRMLQGADRDAAKFRALRRD